ncbi:hypothetical protein VI03_25320 [Burkholderia vietnamiensis]|nr:hypothetical protein VI03_25320 [Burkholderia vietnamiensis]
MRPASPVEQPAATPIAQWQARQRAEYAGAELRWLNIDPHEVADLTTREDMEVRALTLVSQPAPSPADERAAFEVEILTGPCAKVCYTQDEIPREQREQVIVIRKADYDRFIAARAASANETVAISDAATPLDVETVRVIRSFVDRPGETYHGFIQRRLGIGFGRALRRAIEESRSPAMAAEAVAYIAKSDLNKIQRDRTFHVSVIGVCEGRFNTALFAGPQITHADTQERLTAALRLAREELSYIEWKNDPPTRITDLFSTIDALLTAQQERPTPNAARALACTKSPDRDTKDLPSEGA